MIHWKYHSPFQRIGVFESFLFRAFKYRSRITSFLFILVLIVSLSYIFQYKNLSSEGIGLIIYKFHDNIYLPVKGYLWNQVYPENIWFFFLILAIVILLITWFIIGYSLISWIQRRITLCAIKKIYGRKLILLWSRSVGGLNSWLVALGLVLGLIVIVFSLVQTWYLVIEKTQVFSIILISLSILAFALIFSFGYFKEKHFTLDTLGITSILAIVNREMLRVWSDIFNLFKKEDTQLDSKLRYSWDISELECYILNSGDFNSSVNTIEILFKTWIRIVYITEKRSLSSSSDFVNTTGKKLLKYISELKKYTPTNDSESKNKDMWNSSIEDTECIIKYVLYLNKDLIESKENYDLYLHQNLVKVACNFEKRLEILDVHRTQIELGLRRANSRIRTMRKKNTQLELWENPHVGSLAVLVAVALSVVTKVVEYGKSYVDAVDALRFYTDFKDNLYLTKNSPELLVNILSKCSSVEVDPIEYRILSELSYNLSEVERLKNLGIEGISLLNKEEEIDLIHSLGAKEAWAGLKI